MIFQSILNYLHCISVPELRRLYVWGDLLKIVLLGIVVVLLRQLVDAPLLFEYLHKLTQIQEFLNYYFVLFLFLKILLTFFA